MKIVVIGGGGLIGKKLVTRLHERGRSIPFFRCQRRYGCGTGRCAGGC